MVTFGGFDTLRDGRSVVEGCKWVAIGATNCSTPTNAQWASSGMLYGGLQEHRDPIIGWRFKR
jgi:hypothetical protein